MQQSRLTNIQKIVLVGCIVTVPAVFFLTVYQAYRYKELQFSVEDLQKLQQSRFEANKRAIAGIAALSAQARIDALAGADSSLRDHFPDSITYVEPAPNATDSASDGSADAPAPEASSKASRQRGRPAGESR